MSAALSRPRSEGHMLSKVADPLNHQRQCGNPLSDIRLSECCVRRFRCPTGSRGNRGFRSTWPPVVRAQNKKGPERIAPGPDVFAAFDCLDQSVARSVEL